MGKLAFAVVVGVLAIFWQGAVIVGVARDRALWAGGKEAPVWVKRDLVSRSGLSGVLGERNHHLTVLYVDGRGHVHEETTTISTYDGLPATPAQLRYDAEEPSRFVLDWTVTCEGYGAPLVWLALMLAAATSAWLSHRSDVALAAMRRRLAAIAAEEDATPPAPVS